MENLRKKYLPSIEVDLHKQMNLPVTPSFEQVKNLSGQSSSSRPVPFILPPPVVGHKQPAPSTPPKYGNIKMPPHKKFQLGSASPSPGGNAQAAHGGAPPQPHQPMGQSAKAMGAAAKKGLPFNTKKEPLTPVQSASLDYMRSLANDKCDKMISLDNLLDSSSPKNFVEGILGSVAALSLSVDQEKLNNLEDIPSDSLFVTISKYFPQVKTADKTDFQVAAEIRTLLCAYVTAEPTNFSKVSHLEFYLLDSYFLYVFLSYNFHIYILQTGCFPFMEIVTFRYFDHMASSQILLENILDYYFYFLQTWLDAYSYDDNSNLYSLLARNSIPGNSIDGGTIVMLSQMLKQNISIIGWDQIWNCLDAAIDIGIMYGGDNKFVATEVSGMLTYNSTVIVCILHFKLHMNLNVCVI